MGSNVPLQDQLLHHNHHQHDKITPLSHFTTPLASTVVRQPRTRKSSLGLARTAADVLISKEDEKMEARERVKEQQRLEQQRIADEMIRNTQKQMLELQQQLAIHENQQLQVIRTMGGGGGGGTTHPVTPSPPPTKTSSSSASSSSYSSSSSSSSEAESDTLSNSSDGAVEEEESSIDDSSGGDHSASGTSSSMSSYEEDLEEEEEEEKKETDAQQFQRQPQRIPRQSRTPTQPQQRIPRAMRRQFSNDSTDSSSTSQTANALQPIRKSTVDSTVGNNNAGAGTTNSIEQWRNKNNNGVGVGRRRPRPALPARETTTSQNSNHSSSSQGSFSSGGDAPPPRRRTPPRETTTSQKSMDSSQGSLGSLSSGGSGSRGRRRTPPRETTTSQKSTNSSQGSLGSLSSGGPSPPRRRTPPRETTTSQKSSDSDTTTRETTMKELNRIASHTDSEGEEEESSLSFFDWSHHRKQPQQYSQQQRRRHSMEMHSGVHRPLPDTPSRGGGVIGAAAAGPGGGGRNPPMPMGSVSDPNHHDTMRRRHTEPAVPLLPNQQEEENHHHHRGVANNNMTIPKIAAAVDDSVISSQQEKDNGISQPQQQHQQQQQNHNHTNLAPPPPTEKQPNEANLETNIQQQNKSVGTAATTTTTGTNIITRSTTPVPPRSVTHPRPKQPIFLAPSTPPHQQKRRHSLLDDVGFHHDEEDEEEDDEYADEELRRRRHQQNVLRLSSSWNDLFGGSSHSTSSASVVGGQQQAALPKRRGSWSSSGGSNRSAEDQIFQFEPDDEARAAAGGGGGADATQQQEGEVLEEEKVVKELGEREARPKNLGPRDDLLHLSGSLTDFFLNDDDDDDDNDAYDENFNNSFDSWNKNDGGDNNNNSNSSFSKKKNNNKKHNNKINEMGNKGHESKLEVFGSSHSSHTGSFDYFSTSSDDPSKLLRKFNNNNELADSRHSDFTELPGCNKTALMQHLSKHGSKPKPGWRWDKGTAGSGSKGSAGTGSSRGSASSPLTGNSSHHGGAHTTITTISSGGASKPHRHQRTNPMKELRKTQRNKKKAKDEVQGETTDNNDNNTDRHQPPPNHHDHEHNQYQQDSPFGRKDKDISQEKPDPTVQDPPPGRRSRRGSLGAHLEKDKQNIGMGKVPEVVGQSVCMEQSLVASEITTPDVENKKADPSPPKSGSKTRRPPARERQRRTPGRKRSSSLSDLQRLRDRPRASTPTDLQRQKNRSRSSTPTNPSPPPVVVTKPEPAMVDDVSLMDESVDDPMISKYKELVGDLVEQEKTSQTAAAIVKGEETMRKEEKPTAKLAAPPPPDRAKYNWTHSRSRRRASYDWMRHKTHDAADNMLAFVGNDILAAKNNNEAEMDEEDLLPPPVGKGENLEGQGSLTDLVIVVDKDWKFEEKPEFNWSEYDPILTTDSVMHFTGTTPSGAISEMLDQDRRNRLTNGQRPSFSSRSTRSDVAAKKPQRRYTQLAHGVEEKVFADSDLHASYDWIQHGNADAEGEGGLFDLAGGTDPETNRRKKSSKGTLGAFLHASAGHKSTDDINKIFDWAEALQTGNLDKAEMDDSGNTESEASSGVLPRSTSSESVDVPAKKPRRSTTMDRSSPAWPEVEDNAKEANILPKVKEDDVNDPLDKRQSLQEFIGSSNLPITQTSVTNDTTDPTVDTGAAVFRNEHRRNSKLQVREGVKASLGQSTEERARGKDRRQRGVQRTRSKSLTDTGRARRRQKDETPRVSKRRTSVTHASSTSMDNSLRDYLEKDKTSQHPETTTNPTATTTRSTRSQNSRDSMNKSPTSQSSGDANRNRGRGRNKGQDRRRSRSRSLTDMDKMRERDIAKTTHHASKRSSMPKNVGKLKSKTTHETGNRRKTVAGTTRRLSTSMHLNVGDPNELAAAAESRGREDQRPRIQRRRSSSLSDMEGIDKERHGRRGSTRHRDTQMKSGRRSSQAQQPEKVQPRRRRPQRQRSRSLTDMGRVSRGSRKPAAAEKKAEAQRPSMLASYDWQQHSASTRSMMSNSSKPERDRRSMLVRTRSQSLSSLFGDESRRSQRTLDAASTTSNNAGSRPSSRPSSRSSGVYNWSQHRQVDASDETPASPGKGSGFPRGQDGGSPRDEGSAAEKNSSRNGAARGGLAEGAGASYDWDSHPPTQDAEQNAESAAAAGSLNLREQLTRSRSRSLTDLMSLLNTTIEESPFENSGASGSLQSSRSSMEGSSRSSLQASLQASSRSSLQASKTDLVTQEPEVSTFTPQDDAVKEKGASKNSTGTTDSNVTTESDSPVPV